MTRLGRLVTWPLRAWNRSLAFRAVISCLAVSVGLWSLTGILMGQQVSDGLADLVPAADQEATIAVVNRAVALSALIFIPVMALAMYLIALQVTRPLRSARDTAEALAAGDPGRRMLVKGPEDSAALARAVNHMAAELSRRLTELESMGRQQHQFVSDVSHELRTPLTTVRMAADVMYESRDELSPIMARSAELLSREVDRFEMLLHDLLDLSRIDAGAAVLAIEETDIAQLVRDEVNSHEPLATRYGSEIVVDADGPCFARVDAMRIRRVVVNLLTNAIEHGEGQPIHVVVRAGEDSVAIAVRDHGVGLSTDDQAQVFTRFWRADPSRFRTVGGTGLGLAIALENAELHGGSLTVWGRPGGGAQFRLLLPLAPHEPITGPTPWPHVPLDAWSTPVRPPTRGGGARPS
jgi:two-component system, OmpR family, sensor histidine kinase MtrB